MKQRLPKDKVVSIRLTDEHKQIIEKYGGNFTRIWEMGMEKWLEQELPSELKNLAEFHRQRYEHYQNLYIQCTTKNHEKQAKQTADKMEKALQTLQQAHNPDYYLGKEIEGITITQEMLDAIKRERSPP